VLRDARTRASVSAARRESGSCAAIAARALSLARGETKGMESAGAVAPTANSARSARAEMSRKTIEAADYFRIARGVLGRRVMDAARQGRGLPAWLAPKLEERSSALEPLRQVS